MALLNLAVLLNQASGFQASNLRHVLSDTAAEGNDRAIATNSFAEQWSWFGVMYRLCNADISNLDNITNKSLLECLTWLSYETDLESQNKVNYALDNK